MLARRTLQSKGKEEEEVWHCQSYIVSLWIDRHMGSESQTRKPQEKNPDPTPTPSPHCRLLPVHPPSAPTDQHMWWRMTHLFFYKGCVYVKLLKCIKMSSTLGGPPRLPWKITRWKYNFSSGEPGIWTEFCLSLCVSLPSLPCSLTSFLLVCFLPFFNVNSFTVSFVSAHPAMKVEDIVTHTRRYWRFLKIISKLQTD